MEDKMLTDVQTMNQIFHKQPLGSRKANETHMPDMCLTVKLLNGYNKHQ